MHILLYQEDQLSEIYRFEGEPVNIGRHAGSEIRLTCSAASRRHAVIYRTKDGRTLIKDLDSANGTWVNDTPTLEHPLQSGDRIKIGTATLELRLDQPAKILPAEILDDTIFEKESPTHYLRRTLHDPQGPDICFPLKRAKDFCLASGAISASRDAEHALQTMTVMLIQQFRPSRIWACLCDGPLESPTTAVGVSDQGQPVTLEEIDLQAEIRHVLKTGEYLLVPNTATDEEVEDPGSALIVPLSTEEAPAGVLLVERRADWAPYSLGDLDYLMMLALHLSSVLAGFGVVQADA